ncbi:hypothetical protein D3C85_1334740 [compost metagenome]
MLRRQAVSHALALGHAEQRRLEIGRELALAKQQRGGFFLERAHDFGAVIEGDTVVEGQEGVRQDCLAGGRAAAFRFRRKSLQIHG